MVSRRPRLSAQTNLQGVVRASVRENDDEKEKSTRILREFRQRGRRATRERAAKKTAARALHRRPPTDPTLWWNRAECVGRLANLNRVQFNTCEPVPGAQRCKIVFSLNSLLPMA